VPEIPGVLAEERSESVEWFISRHKDKNRGTEVQRGILTQRIAEIKHREKQSISGGKNINTPIRRIR